MHTTKQTPVTCLLFSGIKLGLPKCPLNCSFGCLLLSNMNVPRNSSKMIHILLRPGKIVLIIEVLWLKEKRYSMWISRQIYFYCMNNKTRNWWKHIWSLFGKHYSFPPMSETARSFITLMGRLILKNLSQLSELAITRTQCIWILDYLSLAISRYVLNSVSTLKTTNVLEMSTFLWFDMFFQKPGCPCNILCKQRASRLDGCGLSCFHISTHFQQGWK